MVDGAAVVLYTAHVKPSRPVVSYLTPITGIREEDLINAIAREEALAAVHALLGPDVLLVGQSPKGDAEWLGLEEGVHYHSLHDLSETFKAFNRKYGNTSFCSLEHEATVLLDLPMRHDAGHHDPALDAQASVKLYNKYARGDQQQLERARTKLLQVRPQPSVAKILNYNCDGVCMAAFYPKMCKCDQPSKGGR